MIKNLCAVINDCHNVWIIVFIVIIERVEEYSQTCPQVRAAENGAIVGAFSSCVPKRQAIGSYSSPTTYTKYYVYLPPFKINRLLCPYCT